MAPPDFAKWPQGRQALAIRAHNMFQNNWKRNLLSQNWSDNDAKKNRLQDFYGVFFLSARVGDRMTKTGTADRIKCILVRGNDISYKSLGFFPLHCRI